MSLTSYRAAPPRVIAVLGPGWSFRLEFPAGVSGWSLLPDWCGAREGVGGFGRPGGDLLFRALRRSTIGAEGFHGRVRDGIGCYAPRYGHQAVQAAESARELCERLRERRPGESRGPSCVGP